MSLSKRSLRTHALGMVRGRIAAGRHTDEDLERWAKELGEDVVQELVAEHAPRRPPKKSSSSKKSSEKK